MTLFFKMALILCALCMFVFVLRKIRKSEVTIADSTFWFLFAASLVLLAVFPQVAFFFSSIFNIESPANFVFLYVIAVMVVREFYSTVEISQMRSKLASLVQEQALREVRAKGLGKVGDEHGSLDD